MTTANRIVSTVTAVMFAAALSGCATSSAPPAPSVYVYPAKGQSSQQQATDTSECQTWAQQQIGLQPRNGRSQGAGVGLAVGALGGAALGAAVGAAAGSPGTGAAVGAAAGGLGGATYGGDQPVRKGPGRIQSGLQRLHERQRLYDGQVTSTLAPARLPRPRRGGVPIAAPKAFY